MDLLTPGMIQRLENKVSLQEEVKVTRDSLLHQTQHTVSERSA